MLPITKLAGILANDTTPASPATTFTLSGFTSGTTGNATTFTVTPNGPLATTTIVTPAGSGATFNPTTLTFASGTSSAQTFTVTRATDGTTNVSIANDGGLSNSGSPISHATTQSYKYRNASPYLFQAIPAKLIPNRMPNSSDFYWDQFGPTAGYVDWLSGWAWDNAGGDYLDAGHVRQGSTPWFSIPINDGSSGSSASYTVNITTALQFIQTNNRWNAYKLTTGATRMIAGKFNGTYQAPYISVVYDNADLATLNCRVVAAIRGASQGPYTAEAEYDLPVLIEFDKPVRSVTSATLSFVISQHWSGIDTLSGYVLDPPLNTDSIQSGIASTVGIFDAGIESHPQVIGAHRYLDSSVLGDFCYPSSGTSYEVAVMGNYGYESNYDPAIFGTGPTDTSKFPHVGLGKWVYWSPDFWSLVPSSYSDEGYEPLAPGLAALRVSMPATPGIGDGTLVYRTGTGAATGLLFMPEPLFGILPRIFVRYYLRLGIPYPSDSSKRYQVYNDAPGPGVGTTWTTMGGKCGITPCHDTSYGGFSGSSGGGGGWQMRLSWTDCDAGVGGPDEGGWGIGYHMYDFVSNNPSGYNYGSQDQQPVSNWGQRGGMSGMLYAGQWYCIETELQLNSVGVDGTTGFTPDGALRTWIDGKLVYERTSMVFRTFPATSFAYNPNQIRPARELGIRNLLFNWYHGGVTQATIDRVCFTTGLVWSHSYIGPMKLS